MTFKKQITYFFENLKKIFQNEKQRKLDFLLKKNFYYFTTVSCDEQEWFTLIIAQNENFKVYEISDLSSKIDCFEIKRDEYLKEKGSWFCSLIMMHEKLPNDNINEVLAKIRENSNSFRIQHDPTLKNFFESIINELEVKNHMQILNEIIPNQSKQKNKIKI